jgi:arylsulfatase A-like enzyme
LSEYASRKRIYIGEADVSGTYLAYTDDEIGRMIQAVDDLGKRDKTLIICIGGDNRASVRRRRRPQLALRVTPRRYCTIVQ